MIAVDTSALVALYMREPGWEDVLDALAAAGERKVAAPTLLEPVIVLGRLAAPRPQQAVQALVDALALEVATFAQRLDCPLLFVGEDFRATDVRVAL